MANPFEEFLKKWEYKTHTPIVRFSQLYLRPIRAWLNGDWKHFAALKKIMGTLSGERVLEVGVGSYTDGFSKYSAYADLFVGIDIDRKTIGTLKKWAIENGRREQFLVGDGTGLPFKEGSFDKVLFNNFTGNFEDSLKEAHRVLKRGGRIYLAFLTHPFYFRPKELLSGMQYFWESRGFNCVIPLGWTEKTRSADYYYLTVAEKK